MANHVANHEVGIDFVTGDNGFGGGYKFVVQSLNALLIVFVQFVELAGRGTIQIFVLHEPKPVQRTHFRLHNRNVNFVERQPVLNLVLVAFETGRGVLEEQVDSFAAVEAVVLRDNCPRNFVVAERNQRLYAVLFALVEDFVVEFQARLVRLSVVAVRENARPVNRQPVAFEAHFREKRNVFLEVVVHVNRLVRGVESAFLDCRTESARSIHVAAQQHIRHRKPLAIFTVRAFTLVSSRRAAPKEIFRKRHN